MTTDMLTRAAVMSSTLDVEARTIDVVFASEAPVRRHSWEDGRYDEILACGRENVDLSRADNMMLLDTHGAYSLDDRLGSVVPGSVRFEKGQVVATIKLSRRAKAEELLQDLQDGHSLPISVGYRITQEERTEAERGGVATVRAVRWQPMEISVVPIPADANAKTRSKDSEMPTPRRSDYTTQQPLVVDEEEQVRAEQAANRAMSVREARGFAVELTDAANAATDLPELQARIKRGMSENDVRAALLAVQVERQERSPTFPQRATEGVSGNAGYERQARAREDALYARMTGTAPEGDARDFMADTLVDHARGLLEAQGVSTRGMSREEIVGFRSRSYSGGHTTSDFPLLLEGAGERVLQAAYQAAQSPLKATLSRSATVGDFRAKSTIKVSNGGLLEKVNENGEIKNVSRAEAAESYKIDSYARIFSLSFQALVNDDLGGLNDWSIWAGQMAAATENKILLDLLTENAGNGPLMGEDGKRLFHADHDNLAAAGTALDQTAVEAGILALRKQKALGGQRIGLAPKYLLTGPELETTAQKLVAAIYPTTTAAAVPGSVQALVPIVESNLDGKGWFLFADPASAPVLEYATLAGHGGVELKAEEGFRVLGVQYRAVLHFGAGAVDFRGAYRNPGL